LTQRYGSDPSSQPEFDSSAWIDAISPPTKGQIYGFGSRHSPVEIIGAKSTSSGNSCTSRFYNGEFQLPPAAQEKMNQMESQVHMLAEELAKTKEELAKRNHDFANLEQCLGERVTSTVRMMLRDLNIPNHQFPSGSGSSEFRSFDPSQS
jgi:hypothetical protein